MRCEEVVSKDMGRETSNVFDLRKVKFIAFDFDGVFTDNRVIVSERGEESVLCSRSDGIGLERLREIGIQFAVLSTESNPVVLARCKKLGVPCYSGLLDKLSCLKTLIEQQGIEFSEVAFVGNDINDLPCLRTVGFAVTVADAWDEVRREARYVLKRAGGFGAVREFCDQLYFLNRHDFNLESLQGSYE